MITWKIFLVLTSEGFLAPFIGFIEQGECHVLRKVDIAHTNKNTGLKEKRMIQVVVGKLRKCESFGEVSVILKEPMTCTIVTETPCRIGVIPIDKINSIK